MNGVCCRRKQTDEVIRAYIAITPSQQPQEPVLNYQQSIGIYQPNTPNTIESR
jgi:hypothetical protein